MQGDPISHSELSKALGTTIESYDLIELKNPNRGYLADVFRLVTQVNGQAQSYVLKTASRHEDRFEIAERFGSYRNEQRFYQDLAHDLPFRTPACYLNVEDRFVLLLEDLGDQGSISPLDGASEEQATLAVETLAAMHGHFMANPPPVLQHIRVGLNAAALDMRTLVAPAVSGYSGSAATIAADYAAHSERYINLFERQEQVFTHLDYRLDNMRFLDTLYVLDWGESTHAPIGFDLAAFISGCLSTSNRRHWEDDLLALYQNTLSDQQVRIHRESLFNSYRLSLLPSLYLPGLVLNQGDPDEGRMLLDRGLAAIEDHSAYLSSSLSL
ncbi:MAG: phosphotransferase [Pseudomonadales bacterium]|nr:phosphotransferase [Pseudomonadales bacterium]